LGARQEYGEGKALTKAQATAGDLQNVRLSVQAELAFDYYQLRALDAQKDLLDTTVAAFQQALDLTRVRFQTGIASDEDVALAETNWKRRRPKPPMWAFCVPNSNMQLLF